MTDILALIPFFPNEYEPEINYILNDIKNYRIAFTIEELANFNPRVLAKQIRQVNPPITNFLTEMYATTINDGNPGTEESAVEIVFATYIDPSVIDNPTTKLEQERVNTVWTYFLSLFDGNRQKVMEVISSNFRENAKFSNPENPFLQFSNLSEATFISTLPDLFYEVYSNYLIEAANRYLRVNKRVYKAFGQIKNNVDQKPIKNAKVTALTTTGISITGITYSNFEGFFGLSFTSLVAINGSKNVNILVQKEGYSDLTGTIEYDPNDEYGTTSIELIPTGTSDSALISEIISQLSLSPPAGLTNYFTTKGIDTLSDIRNIGLLRNRKDLSISPSNTFLMQFDSLALLELVDLDFIKNNDLIDAGYPSFVSMASTPRAKFVDENKSLFANDYETVTYYETAKHQAMTAVKEIRQVKDKLDPTPVDTDLENFDECGCQDCNSAVGPMAYLADLISFSFENITSAEGELNSDWLQDNLFRDFTAIPIECDELENTVCQARIATEVLQGKYADSETNPSASALETYNARVIEYLIESYKTILIKLGTSYDELQKYQAVVDSTERLRYANRIGIVLDDPLASGDTINNMFKDITEFQIGDITFLETYFGLASTESNVVPDESKFAQWKGARLQEVWAERDRSDSRYKTGEKLIIDPDIVTVDDFRLPKQDESTAFKIWERRRGFVDVAYAEFDAKTEGSEQVPTIIQDMANLLEASTGFSYTPVNSSEQTIGTIWISDSLNEIATKVDEIRAGDATAKQNLMDIFLLEADEAFRLIDLWKIEENTTSVELKPEEHIEAVNICTQVVKRAFGDVWLTEEVSNSIELSSKMFWISEREPIVGNWPIEVPVTDPLTPLIDPQIISLNGLPEITFRTMDYDAKTILYEVRKGVLDAVSEDIKSEQSIPEMVDYAYEDTEYIYEDNTPPPPENQKTFVYIYNQLNNPSETSTARETIEDDLKLSVEDFIFIMELTASYGTEGIDLKPAEAERLTSILTASRKIFSLYASWVTGESGKEYWQLRKAQLPKWRANTNQREEWKKAYNAHNDTPIIDGDLIGPAYLVNPIDGNAAFDLWQDRYNAMHNETDGWYHEISTQAPFSVTKNQVNFDQLVEKFLFMESGVTFGSLIARSEKDEDISQVLEQLLISSTQFRFLVDVHEKLGVDTDSLLNDQLDRLYYTLALVQKKKEAWQYKIEEGTADITQSPDFFLSRDTDYYTYPPTLPYPLNQYLVSEQSLSSWRKIVSSRTDEERKSKLDYTAMLLETDDDTMSFLRDALVEVLDDTNASTSEKARKLGDELLIDLQDNCCTKTNRVASAIETMQQLIWKTNTEDIYSAYDLTISVTSFDTVWEWMGSYANWRASMFVFLYPENILLPSLKRESTPGFLEIIRNTQNNRNFNPGMACQIAKDYREYIADVSSLDLKTSVQTSVITQKEDHCGGAAQIIDNLTFVFATAGNSGKSYYMTVKSTEEGFSQKTFWAGIPNIHEKAIIKGSDVYQSEDRGIHYIYVFYLVDAFDMRSTIYAVRYNVNKNEWESEPLEFTITKDDFTIRHSGDNVDFEEYNTFTFEPKTEILALSVCENSKTWESPYLAISVRVIAVAVEPQQRIDHEFIITFSRQVSWNGNSFNDSSEWYHKWVSYWDQIVYNNITWNQLTIFGQVGKVNRMVFIQNSVENDDPLWYGYEYNFMIETGSEMSVQRISRSEDLNFVLRKTYFSGETIFSATDTGPLFGIENAQEWQATEVHPYYREIYSDGSLGSLHPFFLNNTFKFSTFNGEFLNGDFSRPFLYQRNDGAIQLTSVKYDSGLTLLEFSVKQFPLSPNFNEIPALDNSLLRPELELLKEQSQNNLLANTDISNPKLRIYSEEAYYFAPIAIARRLSDNGYYSDALKWYRLVYDYFASEGERKIYYGLILEQDYTNLQDRVAEWYEDPLNPHGIAATRKNAYTRFTIMSIGNTLLAYANAEFTRDNSESNPRARELYEDIIDLISVLDTADPCAVDVKIRSLESYLDKPENKDLNWKYKWQETFQSLRSLGISPAEMDALTTDILTELEGAGTEQAKYQEVQNLIQTARDGIIIPTLNERIDGLEYDVVSRIGVSMADGQLEPLFKSGKEAATANVNNNLQAVTGFSSAELPTANLDWLYTDTEAEQSKDFDTNPVANGKSRTLYAFSKKEPKMGFNVANPFPEVRISGMSYLFCVTPNPIVNAILMTAYMNLHKIHNCMNIAGMVRELNPFSAPTDATTGIPTIGVGGTLQMPGQATVAPTNYRYRFLIDRATQLVSIAQQMESSMLQNLEKFDAESYAELKAEQDLELAKAGIKLQDLKVKEANSNKDLAALQKERADIQVTGLQDMIDEGLLAAETNLVRSYAVLGALQAAAQLLANTRRTTEYSLTASAAGGGATAAISVAASASIAIGTAAASLAQTLVDLSVIGLQTSISINSIYASLQRRQQEWNYQKSIASQDVKIGDQQIRIADDRIRIAGQERAIAGIQQDQAQAVLDFLKNKFTNAALYEWMSGVLEDVYSYFLQEATAMSKLAEQQLAFERQIDLPKLIKNDYWNVATNTAMTIGASTSETDRKGLTGSARLLKDLSQLEQYAIDTNQRKLQITKIISLNEHDPVQMEMFRNTGVLRFTTTQRDFDWDYPGHYLRLIRRVSITVIALTPPNKGIKATLVNNGISSVVTNANNNFQKKIISRSPERIALSSPYNEYGMFQLDTNDAMYRPFEGSGVETLWELRMEKASNPFDYRSIADVLLTIEYEALENDLYSKTIKTQLNTEDKDESMVLSMRNTLPDQWYELMNPAEDGSFTHFKIRKSDLAPNVLSNMLTAVKVYFSFDTDKMQKDGMSETDGLDGSILIAKDNPDPEGGSEILLNTFLTQNLQTYSAFPTIEDPIEGEWYVRLTETTQVLEMIDKQYLQDIIIILNYSADKVDFSLNSES